MRSRSGDRLNLKFGSSIQFNTRTQTETKILEVDDPEQFEELKQMLKQGQKVSAIKRFREITGADLTSAKMAMDHLAQALREGRL